jgi:hypothetical protein
MSDLYREEGEAVRPRGDAHQRHVALILGAFAR